MDGDPDRDILPTCLDSEPATDAAPASLPSDLGDSTPSDVESRNLERATIEVVNSVGVNPACLPLNCDHSAEGQLGGALTSDIPPPKRYAHHGKRRRRFTEELFRCQFVDKISRSDLVCNALLWKNRPEELRKHLQEHLSVDEISKMDDDQVSQRYSQAKRIFLQGIPEDADEDQDGDEESNHEQD